MNSYKGLSDNEKLLKIKDICIAASKIYDDNFNCNIKLNKRMRNRTLGKCVIRVGIPMEIHISNYLLENCNNDNAIEDIIKHEWAHYYAAKAGFSSGHNNHFKNICAMIGCNDNGYATTHKNIFKEV